MEPDGGMWVYNHLEITVETNQTLEKHTRIVGLDVEALSIAEGPERLALQNKYTAKPARLESGKPITFTYNVTTKVNKSLTWYTRFDHYLKGGNEEIHLMQLIVSFLVVLSFGLIVAIILKRSLNRDFTNIAISNQNKLKLR